MKKKSVLTLLLILALLLSACGGEPAAKDGTRQVNFYYPRAQMLYGQEDGLITAEARSLPEGEPDYPALLQSYLAGPVSEELTLPVPDTVSVLEVTDETPTLTVTLNRAFSQLTGHDLTVAASCIAMTLLQFDQVQTVRIQAQNAFLAGQEALVFTGQTIVLADDSSQMQNQKLQLYFQDSDHRYLLESVCTVTDLAAEQVPEYLIRQLIQGPADAGMLPVIPEGTMLLSTSVEDNLCIVDFSAEFMTNKPATALEERMVLYAVVNTLTGLDEIDRVQILVEGEALPRYLYQDLSGEFVRDERLIGPIRDGLGEFDCSLCLPMAGQEGLFVCPVIVQSNATAERSKQVLEALLAYDACNGYYRLLPEKISLNAFAQNRDVCVVDFSADPLSQCKDAAQQRLCLQSIALTLQQSCGCQLLQISVNGVALQDLYEIDGEYLVPDVSLLNL